MPIGGLTYRRYLGAASAAPKRVGERSTSSNETDRLTRTSRVRFADNSGDAYRCRGPRVADGPGGADLNAQRRRELVNQRITGKVVSVIDGDTVDLLVAPKRVLRVRLHGIDTPERGEPFSTQARNFTRVLMFSRDVEAIGKDVDAYGRLVARVTVDGKDASATILAAGLGCTYHRYVSDPGLDMARCARA